MKVVDLGHGAVALKTESPSDFVTSLSKERLKQSKVSDEAIDIYLRYIEGTSSPNTK